MSLFLNRTQVIITIISNLYSHTEEALYYNAFNEIKKIIESENNVDFKKAVFITENAYLDNNLDFETFDAIINTYASICNGIIKSGNIIYPEKDIQKASSQCAVFLFMIDSIEVMTEHGLLKHSPFEYNFEDFAGKKDWSSMFVSTLMQTKKGNCHSLPILYKLIMDKLGGEAYLALAPNHMYIKVNNKRVGWYNIELTNGDFPTDAWLMASGYIHIDAIRNGIYMKALSEKESIATCLIDLAQGYQRKFGIQDGTFILSCCELAMKYYPNYVNALLLTAETMTAIYKTNNSEELLVQMNDIYTVIHDLGYRKMPEKMYMNWLNSMGTMTTNHRMKSLIYQTEDQQ